MNNSNISVEDVPLNGFHQRLTVSVGGASLMDGYILSIIGIALVQMTANLQLTNFWQGMIATSALLGIFAGGLFSGWLTDKFGRRKVIFVAPIIFLICSVLQFWTDSPIMIFMLRFLIGIAIAIDYSAATSLFVEFVPKKYRGSRLASFTILWFAGAAMAYIFGDIIVRVMGNEGWRWALSSSVVIGVILLLSRLGTVESARWLITKNRSPDAEDVIKKVYGNQFSLANLPKEPTSSKLSLADMLRMGYGKRLMFVIIFWTCAIIPVFAVYAFAPKVLAALKLEGDWAAYGSVAITLLFVIGCIVGTKLIDVLGRRKMLIHSFLWSGLALLLLGAFSDSSEMVVLVFFGAYALLIGGAQVLELVYPNEIFPTELRPYAMGWAVSATRIGAAIGTFLVPMSLETIGIGNTMYVAAAVTLVGLIVSVAWAPETKSKDLSEAAALE
ncbi:MULTISPECIES: MFS transporter [Acinetobacter]|jgi:putative MFS transporter|uniref:MFS transporter n=1 Tax=Acinetobacter bereziniae TaxID=106648 RepID=A0A8I1AIB1_ACIBZ|nr:MULTISPECIES: MFS transporter [Acinetobacter]MEC8124441.1 MFS transporter [Pseudomonadota bacterium]MBI0396819.1 MFS transporter [Acinetobacter bereziniae]MBJ8421176.1 MFS transporter [Acinetobacter bereziniae]MBJ8425812.1 MFS transporter [Acinetobacter bereziniae]MBJ8452912.1 MFS transporter [Acinetobacter bereziniae]